MASDPDGDTGTGWPDDDPPVRRRDHRPVREARQTLVIRQGGGWRRALSWVAAGVVAVIVLQVVLHLSGWLPKLPNPFATRTTDRSQPALLLSIQDLARFEAASGTFEKVIDVQVDHPFIPDIIFNQRILFVCVGTVDAYVDFGQINAGNITESPDHTTVSVRLPAARLEKPNIDHSKSYVFEVQEGAANKLNDLLGNNQDKVNEMYRLGEQRIAEAAQQSTLVDRAQSNTKRMLEQMLRSLGYTSITVSFAAVT